jgi:uncharacterized membrane protein
VQTISLVVPLLYTLFVIAVCGYLLARGVSHLFVMLFAIGALLHALPTVGFLLLQQAPGGISANASWLGVFSLFGVLGTLVSAAAFLLLASFLMRLPRAA